MVAIAHHSRAVFDTKKEVVIEGTVAKLDWMNPHIYFTVETKDLRGETVLQEIEASSVSEAVALGLRKEAIAPGAHVVVRANPNRQGMGRASGLDVRTSDGAVYPLNTDAKITIAHAVAAEAQTLAGRWAPTLASFSELLPVAQSWPFTAAGRTAQAEMANRLLRPADVAALGICEPIPPPLLSIFPDMRTIEITDTTVTMRFEGAVGLRMERVAHLDQKEHPAGVAPSLMGHSIARWEDETLVVDTVAFEPYPLGLIAAPSSPRKRLVERFTLAEDHLHLQYVFTLEDPQNLAEAASYTATWDYRPDLAFSDVPCDADTARRFTKQ
jgi:hypothetical protein